MSVVTSLDPGIGKLMDDAGAAQHFGSFYVAPEGFFYMLKPTPVVTANKKFTTPVIKFQAHPAPSGVVESPFFS